MSFPLSTLARIRKVLDSEKQPLLAPASEVPHEYTDKYLLTELLGNIAISSTILTLESLGLTQDSQRSLLGWAVDREVSLKFTFDPSCIYSREETREVAGDKYVEEEHSSGLFGTTHTTTKRVVRQVTEHFWDLRVGFRLQACAGGQQQEQCLELLRESARQELMTTADSHTMSPVGVLSQQ
jgi:hypothetical protein